MHRFKPKQKVVRVSLPGYINPMVPLIEVGQVVTIKGPCSKQAGYYDIVGYERAANGIPCSYNGQHFAPLIETDQFVEVTFAKVVESSPITAN